MQATINEQGFGTLSDGTKTSLYSLTNANGIRVTITNFGGVITSIHCPDRQGNFADVVLGFDRLQPYVTDSPYLGALIGRCANRIAGGRFILDGVVYQLDTNENKNHLHGGIRGIDKVVWHAEPRLENCTPVLRLTHLSPDGDQGYPGTLAMTVNYKLTDSNELITEYTAQTDKPTPVNLTQHSYFNLAGYGDVLSHVLSIDAESFTAIDESLIPVGYHEKVEGTPFDFQVGRPIGQRLNDDHPQLLRARGYDHNYVLNKSTPGAFEPAARVVEPESGRVLEVWTTEPGIQFYSGNFLDGSLTGKGRQLDYRSGFCLEPQHFPDSPNQSQFPSVILRPGETYRSRMSYTFSVQN